MSTRFFVVVRFVALWGVIALVAGCDTDPASSLYDPDVETKPDPVITTVDPPSVAIAGVDVVTLTGENFSEAIEENLVYFGDVRGILLEASPTVLQVLSPNRPQPELLLRVAILGAENFSNAINYTLEPAWQPYGDIADFEEPLTITSDMAGNVYASLLSDGRSLGVVRIEPLGVRTIFAASTFLWSSIVFDSNGALYTARGVRALFRFTEGSGQEVFVVIQDNTVKLDVVCFDEDGNLWSGGQSQHVYRITTEKAVHQYPFDAEVQDIVYFSGHLYTLVYQDGHSRIVRFAISDSGDLVSGEIFYDFGETSYEIFSLAINTQGVLFVGTSAEDPVRFVRPDQSSDVLYPGVLPSPAISFAWSAGELYMVQGKMEGTSPDIIRINVSAVR